MNSDSKRRIFHWWNKDYHQGICMMVHINCSYIGFDEKINPILENQQL